MSDAVNLRIDPRTGEKNWTDFISEELDVAEFDELPGVFGVLLTQVPHPTEINVYKATDPSVPLTRITTTGEPSASQYWSDSQQLKPRGYVIVNDSLDGETLIVIYKAGGYLAHKRVLETVIPEGPPGPPGGVDTVFGRSGDVVAASGDYTLAQVDETGTYKRYTATEQTKLAGIESGATKTPAGTVIQYAGTSAPAGYLACDGSSLLRAGTYADLFTAIGTTFGAVDGTHFNIPDMRGLFVRGSGSHGTMTKAAGGAFDGGSVGSTSNDKIQGFELSVFRGKIGGGGSNGYLNGDSTGGDGSRESSANGKAGTFYSDGANGTPRTGDETKPASIAMLYCIKY